MPYDNPCECGKFCCCNGKYPWGGAPEFIKWQVAYLVDGHTPTDEENRLYAQLYPDVSWPSWETLCVLKWSSEHCEWRLDPASNPSLSFATNPSTTSGVPRLAYTYFADGPPGLPSGGTTEQRAGWWTQATDGLGDPVENSWSKMSFRKSLYGYIYNPDDYPLDNFPASWTSDGNSYISEYDILRSGGGGAGLGTLIMASFWRLDQIVSDGPSLFWYDWRLSTGYTPAFGAYGYGPLPRAIGFRVRPLLELIGWDGPWEGGEFLKPIGGGVEYPTCEPIGHKFWSVAQQFSETAVANDGSGLSITRTLSAPRQRIAYFDPDADGGLGAWIEEDSQSPSHRAYGWVPGSPSHLLAFIAPWVVAPPEGGVVDRRKPQRGPFLSNSLSTQPQDTAYVTLQQHFSDCYPPLPNTDLGFEFTIGSHRYARPDGTIENTLSFFPVGQRGGPPHLLAGRSFTLPIPTPPADWTFPPGGHLVNYAAFGVTYSLDPVRRGWGTIITRDPLVLQVQTTMAIGGQYRPCTITITEI